MRLYLRVGVRNRIGHIYLIFGVFKCVVESQGIVFPLVMRIQCIDLLIVAGRLIAAD